MTASERRPGAVVLVHGAWHGAWAWELLAPLLSGHVEAVETTDALKSVLDGKRRFRVDPQLFTADLLTRFAVDEIVDLADGKVLRKLTP